MFKTRMSAIEMSQSSSSAVEIPKVKDMPFTRFDLSSISAEKYRAEIKIEVKFKKKYASKI